MTQYGSRPRSTPMTIPPTSDLARWQAVMGQLLRSGFLVATPHGTDATRIGPAVAYGHESWYFTPDGSQVPGRWIELHWAGGWAASGAPLGRQFLVTTLIHAGFAVTGANPLLITIGPSPAEETPALTFERME